LSNFAGGKVLFLEHDNSMPKMFLTSNVVVVHIKEEEVALQGPKWIIHVPLKPGLF
jgi:hypothetical protein